MKRFWSILGTVLLWVAVIAFAVYFNTRAKQHYAQATISDLDIILTDSLQDEVLVKSSTVNEWLSESGISISKTPLDSVDLVGIEQAIRKNGFIAKANAYVTYDGRLHVEVSQRQPLLRMAVDGYDCYITEEGFVFPTPRHSAVYAPIVTGSYVPPVPAQYVGYVEDYISSLVAQSEQRIEELQREKVPLFEKDKEIRDSIRKVRTIRISRRFWKELRLRFQASYQSEYDIIRTTAKDRCIAAEEDVVRRRRWHSSETCIIEIVDEHRIAFHPCAAVERAVVESALQINPSPFA